MSGDVDPPAVAKYHGLTFILMGSACPEQYNVVDAAGQQVGYVRLRHGLLSVTWPNAYGDKVVLEIFGDGLGCFKDQAQRTAWLEKAALTIISKTLCVRDYEGKAG